MLEFFRIFADSWPIAVMFVAFMGGAVLLYLIRWMRASDEQDKAYRATQAVTVRERRDDY